MEVNSVVRPVRPVTENLGLDHLRGLFIKHLSQLWWGAYYLCHVARVIIDKLRAGACWMWLGFIMGPFLLTYC